MKRRKLLADIKTKAVLEVLKEDQTFAEVTSKYDVHPKLLSQWKQEFVEKPSVACDGGALRLTRAQLPIWCLTVKSRKSSYRKTIGG